MFAKSGDAPESPEMNRSHVKKTESIYSVFLPHLFTCLSAGFIVSLQKFSLCFSRGHGKILGKRCMENLHEKCNWGKMIEKRAACGKDDKYTKLIASFVCGIDGREDKGCIPFFNILCKFTGTEHTQEKSHIQFSFYNCQEKGQKTVQNRVEIKFQKEVEGRRLTLNGEMRQ